MRTRPSNYSFSCLAAKAWPTMCSYMSLIQLHQATRFSIQQFWIQEQLFISSTIWLASTTCGMHQETTLLWQATHKLQFWPMETSTLLSKAPLAREPSDYAM